MFSQNSLEKRKFRRVDFRSPVRFEFDDPNHFGGCLSSDFSESGIRLHFNEFVPLNSQLVVRVQVNEKESIDCKGHVVWVKNERFSGGYQIGLEFESTGSVFGSRHRVKEYIEKNNSVK